MDAAMSSAPCHHLPLLLAPSALHLHGRKVPGGGSSPAMRGRMRVNSLFGDGGGGEDGFRAVRRLVKLNSAIQNRSVRELLEIVGDECIFVFSKIPTIDVSQMGKNMFLLLHAMMLRHHVSFVLKPTENEGFDLGVKWSLEWKGQKLPWDLDCNITTNHVYRGMLLINEVNKVYVPLLQRILEIIHQNLDAVILTLANKFLPEGTLDESDRKTMVACAIIGLVVMLVFYNMFKNL
uniref:Uncharacterized protein n=1 Tax=Leersia perrieri TaxID=77586 RepID=A0A0D9X9G9_9ORYZ